MAVLKSDFACTLGVTTKTLANWVKRLVDARPELLTIEEYKASNIIKPRILAILCSEFGVEF